MENCLILSIINSTASWPTCVRAVTLSMSVWYCIYTISICCNKYNFLCCHMLGYQKQWLKNVTSWFRRLALCWGLWAPGGDSGEKDVAQIASDNGPYLTSFAQSTGETTTCVFSLRLLSLSCKKDRYRKTFLPLALYNDSPLTHVFRCMHFVTFMFERTTCFVVYVFYLFNCCWNTVISLMGWINNLLIDLSDTGGGSKWSSPEQTTPASLLCEQLPVVFPNPLCWHSVRESSLPEQATWSSQVRIFFLILGSPKCEPWVAATAVPQFKCLQTTSASFRSQELSQTVPQLLLW